MRLVGAISLAITLATLSPFAPARAQVSGPLDWSTLGVADEDAIASGTNSTSAGVTTTVTWSTVTAKGASLKDPSGLFNSCLEGNVRRAIDFHDGDPLDEKALKALVRAAVALNKSSAHD